MLSNTLPSSEEAIRREVVEVCQLLHDQGYLAASDGNVSVRLSDGRILVTPSGVAKAFMSPADLLILDRQGRPVAGGTPSGELPMHLAVLNERPDVRVVLHSHPPTCIAISLFKNLRLNGVLPEVILTFGNLEIVPYARPLTEGLARGVGQALSRTDAVIMERHGTVAVGNSVLEAFARTERLEHAAEILWRAHAIARPAALPEQEVRTLVKIYESARTASR